jgi:hypothetical protein
MRGRSPVRALGLTVWNSGFGFSAQQRRVVAKPFGFAQDYPRRTQAGFRPRILRCTSAEQTASKSTAKS